MIEYASDTCPESKRRRERVRELIFTLVAESMSKSTSQPAIFDFHLSIERNAFGRQPLHLKLARINGFTKDSISYCCLWLKPFLASQFVQPQL